MAGRFGWVQRCGIGSSCDCAPPDQMAGIQRDIQPGGRLADQLARVLVPGDGAADAATGRPAWVQRRSGGPFRDGGPERQPSGLQRDIRHATAGGGTSLLPAALSGMGAAFSADFSPVRVHTSSAADAVASRWNAHALTAGSDIVFRAGAYRPGTPSGDRLLAHELAHVIQQRDGIVRAAIDGGPSDPLERAADAAADDALAAARFPHAEGREPAPIRAVTSPTIMQRDATDDLADFIAHDLNAYLVNNPSDYEHILEMFRKLDSDKEDNVAADFTNLQDSATLEKFATHTKGLELLDVLTEAMITGSVSLFESQQAERILIARRNSMWVGSYAAQAERIAALRHKAAPAFSEDARAAQIAADLNAYVANGMYRHVIEVFADLPSRIEDNVAAAFVEQQPDAGLEEFAEDPGGRAMLQVLYDAIITGNVSSFESRQAERILLAQAKWMTYGQYVSEAERIARLRDRAEDSARGALIDAVAAQIARELNGAAAARRYHDIAQTIRDISSDIEDNVASHFIELQTPARLEEFAADHDGRAMLHVLYEAIITGKVSAFERMQAERILTAQANKSVPTPGALEAMRHPPIFPLASRWGTGATIVAGLLPDGQVNVYYQKRTGLDEFKQEIATLTRRWGPEALAGMTLDPDELVVVKLYDQGGIMKTVPAIRLIDFYNQQQEDWLGKVETVTFLAATAGVGGIGAGGILGWADTITFALSAGSLFVNAYRADIAKTPFGRRFLDAWDITEGIAEYYNWGRLGVDGLRLVHAKVSPAFERWRQEAPTGLTSAERDTVATAKQRTEDWLGAVEQAESREAEKYLKAHPPKKVDGEPGHHHADIDGGHHVEEVPVGPGCEFSSPSKIAVPCPEEFTHAEPAKPEEPAKPGEAPAEAAIEAEKAKLADQARREIAQNTATMGELQKKIDRARETANRASAKAVHAEPAERSNLLDQARRNKESIQKWQDEQRSLRWKNNKLRDEAALLSIPETSGGSYKKISAKTHDGVSEAHHMPAWSSYKDKIDLSQGEGPSIWMSEEDHKLTASHGNTPDAIGHRQAQSDLIAHGDFMEAFEMDVRDLRKKGLYEKYERGILQARRYLEDLKKGTKLQPKPAAKPQ